MYSNFVNLQGTSEVHNYHADEVFAPEGLHDLSRKVPKGNVKYGPIGAAVGRKKYGLQT